MWITICEQCGQRCEAVDNYSDCCNELTDMVQEPATRIAP